MKINGLNSSIDFAWKGAYRKGTNFIGRIVERDGGRFTGCLDELDVVAAREGVKETKRDHQEERISKMYFSEMKK